MAKKRKSFRKNDVLVVSRPRKEYFGKLAIYCWASKTQGYSVVKMAAFETGGILCYEGIKTEYLEKVGRAPNSGGRI